MFWLTEPGGSFPRPTEIKWMREVGEAGDRALSVIVYSFKINKQQHDQNILSGKGKKNEHLWEGRR